MDTDQLALLDIIGDPTTPVLEKLEAMRALGWATQSFVEDCLAQEAHWIANASRYEAQYPFKFVCVANQEEFVAEAANTAERMAMRAHPNRAFYIRYVPRAQQIIFDQAR